MDGYKRRRRTNIIYGRVLRYLTCDQWSHHDWPPVGIEVSPLPIGDLYIHVNMYECIYEWVCRDRDRVREEKK